VTAQRCARGIGALGLYRAKYDDKRATLKPRPVHDWTSHAADALRYLAMALDHAVIRKGSCARWYTRSSGWFERQRRHCSSCA
jgi:hypothetical protein